MTLLTAHVGSHLQKAYVYHFDALALQQRAEFQQRHAVALATIQRAMAAVALAHKTNFRNENAARRADREPLQCYDV